MAKKNLYQGELLKTDDWGQPMVKDGVEYDAAGGTAVQNFIKKSLDKKWGCIYDTNKGKYLVFADEESKNLYLEHEDDEPMDPEIEALVLAEMNSYSNYRILINLDTEQTKPTNAILIGQTGNKVAFVAQTFDNDDNPLLEGLTINYTITRPDGSKSFVTHFTQTDKREELTVDNYLVEGQNSVTINIVGATSNAIANTTIIFQVINLKIEDNYDISTVHDISDGKTSSVLITWAVSGSSVSGKFLEWYVDGERMTTATGDDPQIAPSGADTGRYSDSIAIDAQHFSEGRHNIQYRAWIIVNDQKFYTRTYYKDFIVYAGGTDPIVAISYSIPIGKEPFTGSTYQHPVYYDAVQYTNFTLPIAVYKNNTLNVNTVVELKYMKDGEIMTDVSYSNQVAEGEIWEANITPNITGDADIVITAGDHGETTYVIGSEITENNLNVHEITAGLRLDLRATGKSNTASDRDQWAYVDGDKTYETIFSGVTFDETSGWNDNALVLSNGDSIDIQYHPLTNTVGTKGLTFEIEFSTFNVSDDNAVICDLKSDSGNAGLIITASEARFSDSLSNTVSTKYKSNENYRISFVVDPVREAKPLILIYVNGTLCGGIGYMAGTSEFFVDKTIKIQSSQFAGVRVKHIRIYDEPLSAEDILNNYTLYRDTYREMEDVYNRNDLYVSSGVFDFDRIASILPIMFITDYDRERNNLDNLMSFGTADKKTAILTRQVIYINNLDPSTSFCVDYAQFTPQGTSSMNYPIKNLRLYIKDKAKGKWGTWPKPVLYTGDTKNPETMISLSNPYGTGTPAKKNKVSFKSGLAGTFSEGERKPQAVDCWTMKADYAESSSSHNTGVARIWNKVMRDAILGSKYVSRTRAQEAAMNNPDYQYDVRTSVDGFPCVVFYRYSLDDTNWKFLGKYNFNNDKSTESVFGFCDIPGIAYQEYDYVESSAAEYDQAYATTPDDCREKTMTFVDWAAYEKTVRKAVGKEAKPGETPEELTDEDYEAYVISLCATPYEYSKTYQKADTYVGSTLDRVCYRKKVMTSGDKTNKIYCIEVLENEAAITNFTAEDTEFDRHWEEGFEFRYPEIAGDDENPDAECQGGITNLREFYSWCHSTMNTRDTYDANPTKPITIAGYAKPDGSLIYKQESRTYIDNGTYVPSSYEEFEQLMNQKFQKEKWDHLDVFKVAAYYIYLMRFGAVDQVCKNSMFTSEGTVSYIQNTTTTGGEDGTPKSVNVQYIQPLDGRYCKWFFINYDNDTILGLNNDGQIAYGPDIDRKTQTGDGYWLEHDHPTQEMIDACRPEQFNSIDDLKHATEIPVEEGGIVVSKGDKFLIGGSVWEWSNESSYAYAGHNSVLWNNLEADDEFMTIVRDMDDAIYRAGLSYDETIKMFNEKQATMWCEHILNDDAKIKYVSQYTDKGNNHLSKMHGPRTSHRMWWLSKRFTYFDSKFVSGEYMNTKIVFKIQGDNSNPTFIVKPTEFMNYGWGVTSRSMGQTGISSRKDDEGHFETISFYLPDGNLGNPVPGRPGTYSYSQGDPVEIYASPYMSELDLSNFAVNMMVLDFEKMSSPVLGSQLKRLILGKEGRINGGTGSDSLKTINLLNRAEKLEYIDIRGFKDFTSLDISQNLNMKEVYAFNSGLQGISFPNGAKIERLSLPECYNTLQLHSVNYLTKDNIVFENDNKSNLTKLIMDDCDALKETSYDFLKEWYQQRNGNYAGCVVEMIDIDWKVNYSELDMLEELKSKCATFVIRGKVKINGRIDTDDRDETVERVNRIKALFGENCFNAEDNPPVIVNTSDIVIINASATEVTANKKTVVNYSCEIYPEISNNNPSVLYQILTGQGYGERTGVSIANNLAQHTAVLTTQELVTGSNDLLTIRVTYRYQGSNPFTSDIKLLVKDPTYPANLNNISVSGLTSLKESSTYDYDLYVNGPDGKPATGSYEVEWSFNKTTSPYIDYENSGIVDGNQNKYRLVTSNQEPETSHDIRLTAKVTCENGDVFNKNIDLLILNKNVVLTIQSNPVVMGVCRNAGWAHDSNVLMKDEAMEITDLGNVFQGLVSNAFTFNELVEFENLQVIPDDAFAGSNITEVTIPSGITYLGTGAFQGCDALTSVSFNNTTGITTIPERCFYDCHNLMYTELPESILTIDKYTFGNTTNINKILVNNVNNERNAVVVPNTLLTIANGAFEGFNETGTLVNETIEYIEIPDGLGAFPDTIADIESTYFDWYLVRGKNVTEFKASENNITYSTPDGVLYNLTQQTMYKYPCGKTDKTYYETSDSCMVLFPYGFDSVKLSSIKTLALLRTIGEHQFSNSNVVTIDMGESDELLVLSDYAFSYCQYLTAIIYPPHLTTIGTKVFSNDDALTEINIPNTVTTIYQNVIDYCPLITSLELPDSIVEVLPNPQYIISNCQSLTYVKFPKYLKVQSNICDCRSLVDIVLPVASYYNEDGENVTVNQGYGIRYLAGNNTYSLMNYHIPDEDNGQTYVEIDGAIYQPEDGMLKLVNVPKGRTSFVVSNNVKTIGSEVFRDRNALTAITLSDSVTKIEDRAFWMCYGLKSLNIPDSVRSFGQEAFASCTSLETAVVGTGITEISDRVFMNCSNLRSVVYKGKNITNIRIQAFHACSNLSSLTVCSLSVPQFDNPETNISLKKGKHAFGFIATPGYEEFAEPGRTPSTFTGYLVDGPKKFKVPYFSNGNDVSIDMYKADPLWSDPLFTPVDGGDTGFDSGCGFSIEYLTFADEIYIKIVNMDGTDYTYNGDDVNQIPYIDNTAIGTYQSSGEHAGYYEFSLGANIISDKPVTVTIGISGTYVGMLRPSAYEDHKYTMQIGAAGRGMKSLLLGASDKGDSDINTVSRYDYDRLVSKINSLETKLKKISENE